MSVDYNLPKDFADRMRAELKEEYAAFAASYQRPPERALRVNTLKLSVQRFKEICPFPLGEPVPWCAEGFYIDEEKPGRYIEHAAGLYYVQEPSAMCAAPLLGDLRGKNVLDLCSAPGGKGTQLASAMQGKGILFLNEINFSRAKILSQNVERMGVRNAIVTVSSPAELAKNYPACFDAVLVDAPCSGEGMFKKEEAAISEWSAQNVDMCARRQSEILESAAKLLKAGGKLVYSTCTFAREEDEGQIEHFTALHPEFRLITRHKLWPHKVRGEGHFAALLEKTEGDDSDFVLRTQKPQATFKEQQKQFSSFARDSLAVEFGNLYAVGETLYSLPYGAPVPSVQTLRAGVRLGEFVGGRFVPSHSLAMCLRQGEADFVEVTEEVAAQYLRGLTFPCEGSGWKVVFYKGFPLGWCKVGGGTAKNHYPKGLRTV